MLTNYVQVVSSESHIKLYIYIYIYIYKDWTANSISLLAKREVNKNPRKLHTHEYSKQREEWFDITKGSESFWYYQRVWKLSPAAGDCGRRNYSPFCWEPEPTNVLSLQHGVGQNIAMHASPTAMSFFLVLICTFSVHSPLLLPNPLPSF